MRKILTWVIFIVLSGILILVIAFFARSRYLEDKYQNEHSAERIVGKTLDQIEKMYGTPDYVEFDSDQKPSQIIYNDRNLPVTCWIRLKNGVAAGVGFTGQGVAE
jgi:hypothetical protein